METWTYSWAFRNLLAELLMPPGIWLVGILLALFLFKKRAILQKVSVTFFVISPSLEFYERFSYYFIIGVIYTLLRTVDILARFKYKIIYIYVFIILLLPVIRFNNVLSNPESYMVYVPYRNILISDIFDQDPRDNLMEKIREK